ncbi:unnamed protein product [Dracunculus medinensis]|uniref:Activin_recp domain-containing protein n=1 Tax=Dracunculus medinensis TaxID=318479 RepID=A0A0N4US67_DRAME|nr:unnamed protein product [Dracunculus medinensis]
MIIAAVTLALLCCVGQSYEQIYDPLCIQKGRKCGNNMVYRVIDEVKYADDVSPKVICIVECTCINEQYERKNGQCIEKNNITKRNEAEFGREILPKHCAGRVCALDEEIFNVPCSLTGKICGTNMIFTKIGKLLKKNGTEVCFQKCTCMSEEYVKANGQCILSTKGNETATPTSTQRSATESKLQPTMRKVRNLQLLFISHESTIFISCSILSFLLIFPNVILDEFKSFINKK